jgi:hypothetical protein
MCQSHITDIHKKIKKTFGAFSGTFISVANSWKNNSAKSSEKFGRREKNSAVSSRCLYDHC